MRLSINTGPIAYRLGLFRSIEILSNAGFDAVDVSLMSRRDYNIINHEDYVKRAEQVRDFAKECGIEINQSHAVFPTSYEEIEKAEEAFKKVVRGIHAAAIMGADVIIVHPNQHLRYADEGTPEKLKSMNFEFYNKLLPVAEKYNIKMAVENMFQYYDGVCHDSTCSRAAEFNEYIDMMNSEYITACLDIGHCALVGGQTAGDVIRAMGNRITALHVHDNNLQFDYHLAPFTPYLGKIDWEDTCKALAEINYSGDFTFETDGAFKNVNEDTVQSLCCYIHDIGRHLIEKIEKYKHEV